SEKGNAGRKNKVSGIASNQAVTRAMSDSLVCEYTSKDSVPLRHYHNSKKSSASPHRFQKYTFFIS
ncbi:MAG: hypothetical protein ACLTZ4_07060, partial [Dorea sp.]